MADLDKDVLQGQLQAAGERILKLKRKPGRGYQGHLELEDVAIVVVARDDTGTLWYVDPAEIADADPDVFAREYVRVGHERKGLNVVAFLERFLPIVSPKAAGVFSALKGWFGVLLVLAILAGPALAGTLTLDHAMLTSLVHTREPAARIGYTSERVEFRTRRSALVGWIDVLLTARFERNGRRVQLVAQSLRAGPLGEQRGKRFEEARAGLLRLVDVETTADIVRVVKDGEVVYSQDAMVRGDAPPPAAPE